MDSQNKKEYKPRAKREAERFRGSIAEYSFEKEDSVKKTSFLKNISIKGVCLVVNRQIELNTNLYLTIYLPGITPSIKAKGRVIWKSFASCFGKDDATHYDLGMEFLKLSDYNLNRLIRLLHIVKPYRP